MNNAVFRKMMENIRKHRNIKLVTSRESYLCTVMKPNFKSGVLFGENLMGCKTGKNKPVYLSQAILDLSKTVMYEFHYDYMEQKYDSDKLKLCYMDTDSLVFHINSDDYFILLERLMDQKTRNVKEERNVSSRKLYHLMITRIVS